ncbi:putative H/ACA ribonucleoprotein complex non-core subunit Naf1 [Helianthus anomalus]
MNTSEGSKNLGDLIEEQIGKVCLTSGAELKEEVHNNNVSDSDVDNGEVKTVEGNVEDSEEDESSSSSSSSSSDDDSEEEEEDEEEGVKGEGEMEEGEIKDEVIAWSDADDEDGDVVKGPIRSKNEVQDLPPVPPVTVTIQPHHQTLPVGAVLSVSSLQIKKKPALGEGGWLLVIQSNHAMSSPNILSLVIEM